jgi:hypothetical protein
MRASNPQNRGAHSDLSLVFASGDLGRADEPSTCTEEDVRRELREASRRWLLGSFGGSDRPDPSVAVYSLLAREVADAGPRALFRMLQVAKRSHRPAQTEQDIRRREELVFALDTWDPAQVPVSRAAAVVVSLAEQLHGFRGRTFTEGAARAVERALLRAPAYKAAAKDRGETLFRAAVRALGLTAKQADALLEFRSKRSKRRRT